MCDHSTSIQPHISTQGSHPLTVVLEGCSGWQEEGRAVGRREEGEGE
jgi:hypothetical protein